MPEIFGSAIDQFHMCRRSAALFDYSFLLRLRVEGAQAVEAVSNLCQRDFSTLSVGGVRYALHASKNGRLISDLTVWQIGPKTLDIMSGRATDASKIMTALLAYDVNVFDLSDHTAVLALQGPATNACLGRLADEETISEIPSFGFRELSILGAHCIVGRLGFTGLDGVEILCVPEDASRLWPLLAQWSQPASFKAADMLRLKAGLPLFSREFSPPVTATDIGLSRIWGLPKGTTGFCEPQVARVLFSAKWVGHGPQPPSSDVQWKNGDAFPPPTNTVAVTSICNDPTTEGLIGMGYISARDKFNKLTDMAELLKDIQVTRVF